MQDLQNLPPELQMQMQSQEMPQEQIDQLLALQNQPTQNNSSPLTQPAMENLLAGISPAL